MIQVRRTTYRGTPGYLICGRDPRDRKLSIFTLTLSSARKIQARVRRDERIEPEDWE